LPIAATAIAAIIIIIVVVVTPGKEILGTEEEALLNVGIRASCLFFCYL